ncbi:dienelactone hydrolase family protein [Nocardia sp. NPDC049526]|uniref:dienelactone hydrolase family protein n=1 Tax=Nocardia sp. NPDC049526 TaxID=3364316 RepID=UPI00378B1693
MGAKHAFYFPGREPYDEAAAQDSWRRAAELFAWWRRGIDGLAQPAATYANARSLLGMRGLVLVRDDRCGHAECAAVSAAIRRVMGLSAL